MFILRGVASDGFEWIIRSFSSLESATGHLYEIAATLNCGFAAIDEVDDNYYRISRHTFRKVGDQFVPNDVVRGPFKVKLDISGGNLPWQQRITVAGEATLVRRRDYWDNPTYLVAAGKTVTFTVTEPGYISHTGTVVDVNQDTVLPLHLERIPPPPLSVPVRSAVAMVAASSAPMLTSLASMAPAVSSRSEATRRMLDSLPTIARDLPAGTVVSTTASAPAETPGTKPAETKAESKPTRTQLLELD